MDEMQAPIDENLIEREAQLKTEEDTLWNEMRSEIADFIRNAEKFDLFGRLIFVW